MCVIRSAVSNAKMKTPLQYLVFFDGERNFSGVAYTCKKAAEQHRQQKHVIFGQGRRCKESIWSMIHQETIKQELDACVEYIIRSCRPFKPMFHVFFCHQTASRVQFYTLTHAVLVVWRRFDMHTWELSIFRCFSRDTHTPELVGLLSRFFVLCLFLPFLYPISWFICLLPNPLRQTHAENHSTASIYSIQQTASPKNKTLTYAKSIDN